MRELKNIINMLREMFAGAMAGAVLGLIFYIVLKSLLIFVSWEIDIEGSLEPMRIFMGIGAFLGFLNEFFK